MTNINKGNQTVYFDFKLPTSAKEFNRTLHGIIVPGIYKGGLLTHLGGNLITISAFSVMLNIDDYKSITVQTQETASISTKVTETLPYICINYSWTDAVNNYIDFEFKATITAYDVCFGKAVFTGGVITSFDYTYRTRGLYNFDEDVVYVESITNRSDLTPVSGVVYGADFSEKEASISNNPVVNYTPSEDGHAVPKSYIDENISSTYIQHSGIVDGYVINDPTTFYNYFFSNINELATTSISIALPLSTQRLMTDIVSDGQNVSISNQLYGGTEYSNVGSITWDMYCNSTIYSISQNEFVVGNLLPVYSLHKGYVFGGSTNASLYIQLTDKYNTTSDFWNSVTPFESTGRTYLTSFASSSKCYVAGGATSYSSPFFTGSDLTDEYDPDQDSWESKTPFNTPARYGLASFFSTNGYITGGYTTYVIGFTNKYDIGGDSWSIKDTFGTARSLLTAFTLSTYAYAVGGSTPLSGANVNKYDIGGDSWSTGIPITSSSRYALASFVILGKGYIAGGFDQTIPGPINLVTEYNETTESWSDMSVFTTERNGLVGFSTASKGYITGGEEDYISYSDKTDEYNPLGNYWHVKNVLSVGRRYMGGSLV